jgi:hypothetical protein
MPKRVIDFDAMWGSDKLAACAPWAQAEYAWLYGLADASGCFELTNLRVIWGKVAAIRGNLSIERLEQVFAEFQDHGLLFVWAHDGKRYAHWTGSDVPGRLPPPSWRMRLEKFAPPVPKQQFGEYMAKFARGRAAYAGGGFRAAAAAGVGSTGNIKFENSDLTPARDRGGSVRDGGELKAGVERAQGQDLGLDWNLNQDWEGNGNPKPDDSAGDARRAENEERESRTKHFHVRPKTNANSNSNAPTGSNAKAQVEQGPASHAVTNAGSQECFDFGRRMNAAAFFPRSEKELAVARELRVGAGPVCGPSPVRREVLERERQREAARRATNSS